MSRRGDTKGSCNPAFNGVTLIGPVGTVIANITSSHLKRIVGYVSRMESEVEFAFHTLRQMVDAYKQFRSITFQASRSDSVSL